jgi:hypothetical protein
MDLSFIDDLIARRDVGGLSGWRAWWPILAIVAIWLALVAFLIFLLTRVNYRVGPKHLKVTVLGIPVRRIRLDNIRNIHTRKTRFAEKWHNTLQPRHDRVLVIEKRHGWFRHFEITPEQRYVFKAELDRAIRAHLGLKPGPTAAQITTFDKMQAPAETDSAEKPASDSGSAPANNG